MNQIATAATATKPNQKALEQYEQQLAQNALGGFSAASDLAACLLPLLKALGWKGDPRHVAESLPHFANDLDLTGLRNVLATLNYSSRPEILTLETIDARLLPCLFLPDKAPAMVIKALNDDGTLDVFDSAEGASRTVDGHRFRGTAYFRQAGQLVQKHSGAIPSAVLAGVLRDPGAERVLVVDAAVRDVGL